MNETSGRGHRLVFKGFLSFFWFLFFLRETRASEMDRLMKIIKMKSEDMFSEEVQDQTGRQQK